MNCECKRRVQERGRTILELQELLASERLENGESCGIPDITALMALQIRLERVQRWGGPYSKIEFSEEVKEILGDMNSPLRRQKVVS